MGTYKGVDSHCERDLISCVWLCERLCERLGCAEEMAPAGQPRAQLKRNNNISCLRILTHPKKDVDELSIKAVSCGRFIPLWAVGLRRPWCRGRLIMISGKAERTCSFHLFFCGFHQDKGTKIKMICAFSGGGLRRFPSMKIKRGGNCC